MPSLDFHPSMNMLSKNGMSWFVADDCSMSQKARVLVILNFVMLGKSLNLYSLIFCKTQKIGLELMLVSTLKALDVLSQ